MPALLIELRPNETLLVNGAALSFPSRTRVVLKNKARFLFGKQIMLPEEAITPLRSIYFALQTAYVGEDAQRQPALQAARSLAARLDPSEVTPEQQKFIDQAIRFAESDDYFGAIKLARKALDTEDLGQETSIHKIA